MLIEDIWQFAPEASVALIASATSPRGRAARIEDVDVDGPDHHGDPVEQHHAEHRGERQRGHRERDGEELLARVKKRL